MATVRRSLATWLSALVLSTLAVGCAGPIPDAAGRETALASVARESYFRQQLGAGKFVEACPQGVAAQWRCDAVGLRDTNDAPRSEDAGYCAPYYYLCTGEVGYNGPTGNGTPDGLGAF